MTCDTRINPTDRNSPGFRHSALQRIGHLVAARAAEDGKNAGTFLELGQRGHLVAARAAEDGKNAGTFLLSLVKEAHPPDGKTHAVLRPGQLLQRSIQHWSSTRLLQVKHDAVPVRRKSLRS